MKTHFETLQGAIWACQQLIEEYERVGVDMDNGDDWKGVWINVCSLQLKTEKLKAYLTSMANIDRKIGEAADKAYDPFKDGEI